MALHVKQELLTETGKRNEIYHSRLQYAYREYLCFKRIVGLVVLRSIDTCRHGRRLGWTLSYQHA